MGKTKLFITDIDNTLFDWVTYYVNCFQTLLSTVGDIIGEDPEVLAAQAKEVFSVHGSIEYPFLIQELPAVMDYYKSDIDGMLNEAVQQGRDRFLDLAEDYLSPYEGVIETLHKIRERFPDMPIAALTDAPRYVAMWKLNKLGILEFFDAVYGLPDPRIPTSSEHGRVKVDPEILLKHLQQSNFGFQGKIRNLPDEYEKPGTRGLKTVLMDYGFDEDLSKRAEVVWAGDNLRKDVGLGRTLGLSTAWASYGTIIAPEMLDKLATFSPPQNIHKNAALPMDAPDRPVPDIELKQFSDILGMFK